MAKKQSDIRVLTANRLSDGLVVFLSADGGWSEWIDEAEVARDAPAHALLEQAGTAASDDHIIVEPYLVDVAETESGIVPVQHRERMRTRGPSVRPDLGKQAAYRGAGTTERLALSG